MKYLIALSIIWCAIIISRKPKEPTDPNIIKNHPKIVNTITRS
jgi:hypothetical protein